MSSAHITARLQRLGMSSSGSTASTSVTTKPIKPQKCKIMLLGHFGSGKTALCLTFCLGWGVGWDPNRTRDICSDDILCKQKYIDGQPWMVSLHDSTHDYFERSVEIIRALRTSDGALVLCDIAPPLDEFNNRYSNSMMRFVQPYYNQVQGMIQSSAAPSYPGSDRSPDSLVRGDFPMFLVGTQTDKPDRKFSHRLGVACAENCGWKYFECSAASGQDSVEEVVYEMVRTIQQIRLRENGDRILAAEAAERRARRSAERWRKEKEKLMKESEGTPKNVEVEAEKGVETEKEEEVQPKASLWKRIMHRFRGRPVGYFSLFLKTVVS